jgi:hypothetical protein
MVRKCLRFGKANYSPQDDLRLIKSPSSAADIYRLAAASDPKVTQWRNVIFATRTSSSAVFRMATLSFVTKNVTSKAC